MLQSILLYFFHLSIVHRVLVLDSLAHPEFTFYCEVKMLNLFALVEQERTQWFGDVRSGGDYILKSLS